MGYNALRPGSAGTLTGVNDAGISLFTAISAVALVDAGPGGEYYSRELIELRVTIEHVPLAERGMALAVVLDSHGRLLVQAAARSTELVKLQVEQQLAAKAVISTNTHPLNGGYGDTVAPTTELRDEDGKWRVNGKTMENDNGEVVLQLRLIHESVAHTVVTMLMLDERGDLVAFSTAETEKQAWKAAKAAMDSREIDVPFE